MNRQILFRGKCVNNGEWVEGFLFQLCYDSIFCWCIGKEPLSPNDYSELYGFNREWFYIDESTICQYTGEKDKNGQEIFEGDILEAHLDDFFTEDVTRVSVTFENMKWCLVQKGMIPDTFETGEGKDWEVIGNIFDNQELIGETKDGESR